MIFVVINAVLSAVLLLVVVMPPLYIYDPDLHLGEPNGPPSAGEVIPDEAVAPGVQQKLYLLVMIPFCASVNALFLYGAYYRPVRFVHYRVQLNLLTLRLALEAGRQYLQKNGFLPAGNPHRSFAGGGGVLASSFVVNSYATSPALSRMLTRSVQFSQGANPSQTLETNVNWEWQRHARPKSVRKDVWVNPAVFAVIQELRDAVEHHFLIESNVAEANFTKAVVKMTGVFVPSTIAAAVLPGQVTAPTEARENEFYESSRPPLAALGAARGNGGAPLGRSAMLGMDEKALQPMRDSSVLLLPMQSSSRGLRGDSFAPSGSNGASGDRRSSRFHLFRSGHGGHADGVAGRTRGGRGEGRDVEMIWEEPVEGSGGGGTGDRRSGSAPDAHEPIDTSTFSPHFPSDEMLRGGGGGGTGRYPRSHFDTPLLDE